MARKNPVPGRKPAGWWLAAALAVWGISLASIVGSDGEPVWRLVRVIIVLAAALAVMWLSFRLPRLGAAAALVPGTIGLVTGIVFGFHFLAVDGFSWRVLAGFLGLASGLVLLVLAGRRLLSGLGLVWRSIAVPVLVIVVAVGAWIITPAVWATNVPPIPPGESLPQDFGLTAEEVHFTTSDGVRLGAWYIPSTNRAAVVLRHGSGSTGSDVLAQAAVLAKHGYGVLITDARGHGLSSGRAMDFGWYGDIDTEAAVSFLAARPEVDVRRIGVVGLSMGGEEAVGAAAFDRRISAVVAEGATARTVADKAWLAEVYGIRGRIQTGLEWAQYSLTDWLTEASKPAAISQAVRLAAPRPILLIAAGEVETEQQAAAFIQRESPSTVTVRTVPGASHTQGLATDPAGWESMVTGFLDSSLGQ